MYDHSVTLLPNLTFVRTTLEVWAPLVCPPCSRFFDEIYQLATKEKYNVDH